MYIQLDMDLSCFNVNKSFCLNLILDYLRYCFSVKMFSHVRAWEIKVILT